jgi:taurine dioxygenase
MLLDFLYLHIRNPEFQVRIHWQPGDIAFWDNRVTQHYAVPDYRGRRPDATHRDRRLAGDGGVVASDRLTGRPARVGWRRGE